jgi:hypothetical protein
MDNPIYLVYAGPERGFWNGYQWISNVSEAKRYERAEAIVFCRRQVSLDLVNVAPVLEEDILMVLNK